MIYPSFVGVFGVSESTFDPKFDPAFDRPLARVTVPLVSFVDSDLSLHASNKPCMIELLCEIGIAICDGGPVGAELACEGWVVSELMPSSGPEVLCK